MKRRQADIAVGILIAGILLIGVFSAIQLFLMGGAVMDQMESAPVIHFVGPLLGSLVIASIVGGVYVFVRGQVFSVESDAVMQTDTTIDPADETDEGGARTDTDVADSLPSDSITEYRILEMLPDDEHRVLEPVIESPGLTQIEVRDRSGFSRSKVSQTVTDLEKRGLLYRERQGRTYRVYPSNDLDEGG